MPAHDFFRRRLGQPEFGQGLNPLPDPSKGLTGGADAEASSPGEDDYSCGAGF